MTTTKKGFGSLGAMRDGLPPGPTPAPLKEVEKKGPARAVVRMERKQRGGKEVTVIEKLGLPAKELEVWCKQLKQTLGCGGTVEADTIVLQGDFRPRLT
ncbi:MAG TPA: translation initiation factor, partial [Kofleriaceae bacterium]